MTLRTLILRSLRFHARSHLGALLGAAVGSAVLIGALVVGDSVRGSLRDMALTRLAGATLAMDTRDRFFTTGLFDRMTALGSSAAVPAQRAPVNPTIAWGWPGPWPGSVSLHLPATVSRQDDSARANRVQLYGVGEHFTLWSKKPPENDEVWLNESLARQLRVQVSDELVFRVHKPSALSRDAVIMPRDDASVALRLKVAKILPARPGDFNLTPSQIPPLNAFMSLNRLGKAAGLEGRANLLVIGHVEEVRRPNWADEFRHQFDRILHRRWNEGHLISIGRPVEGSRALPKVQGFLDDAWSLSDAELNVRLISLPESRSNGETTPSNLVELSTPRIFLDPVVAQAALSPNSATNGEALTNGMGVLTYLANEIRVGERATPYSMVAALGPQGLPNGMSADEILINDWLAEDLNAHPGDRVELSYYVLDTGSQLIERTNVFRVRKVVPMSGLYADRTLMPEFPGLAKAESTHDWDAGFKLVHEIRAKDEDYWKKYRGTPKAFITLAAGQKMWGSRFGNLTAIRWPVLNGLSAEAAVTNLSARLRSSLKPEQLGFQLEPVRERALAAADQSQDFGGLFIGFSFFLIVAALLLMALLFQFGVEQRATEIGTLLALGFTPKKVRRMLLLEGGALALVGGVIGVAGGIWYARAMLWGLSTIWQSAVNTSALRYHVQPQTLGFGAVGGVLVAWLTIWFALRKQARRPARELLAEGAAEEMEVRSSNLKRKSRGKWVGAIAGFAALASVGWALWQKDTSNAETFFSAGALLLIAGIAFSSAYLSSLAGGSGTRVKFTLNQMGIRNCARRRKRSLATLGLLACGSFLIASIGVFRLDSVRDAEKRSSGTGGFALIGESTLSVVQDLNTKAGREFFGLDDQALEGAQVVPMRVREGDEASCLNLNHAQKPRLLGVKPELLADRKAFTFVKKIRDIDPRKPWLLLEPSVYSEVGVAGSVESPSIVDTAVPAIGDEASILWAMGKKVGDTLDYTDERGRTFKIRLVGAVANSILQGNLLIDEDAFVRLFPGEAGYRMFLIDTPPKRAEAVSKTLSRALRDWGLELTPATERLAAFNAVQNTYLSTFQVLGGLGLLLGSIGLGVVVMRNVLERRGELALLLAVGFRRRALKWLVLSENGALLLLGLAVGVVAALVAVLPAVLSPGAHVPYVSMALTLGGVLVSGAAWTWAATELALRGRLLDALRNE